jgi:hypothetical protein
LEYLQWGSSRNGDGKTVLYHIERTNANDGNERAYAVEVDATFIAERGHLMIVTDDIQLRQPKKAGESLFWFEESILDHLL